RIERLRELRENDQGYWSAIAPSGSTHEVIETFEDGHRCLSRITASDGTALEIHGDEREIAPDTGGSRQWGGYRETLTLGHYRKTGNCTRHTRWMYIRGPGMLDSYLEKLQQAPTRLRDYYERLARNEKP